MDILTLLANWAQIIGLPIAIIAIAIAVWQYRKGKQKRALSCTFDAVVSPITITAGDALKGEIEIRYRGKAVENLFVVRAHLKNIGNLAIRKSDVIESIKFTFAENSELIRKPLILSRKPSELSVDWSFSVTGNPPTVNSTSLILELLNPGDELNIEFVCTGNAQIPKVSARIEGMPQIDAIDAYEASLIEDVKWATSSRGIFVLFVSLLMTLISLLASGLVANEAPRLADSITVILVMPLFMVTLYILFFFLPRIRLSVLRKRK